MQNKKEEIRRRLEKAGITAANFEAAQLAGLDDTEIEVALSQRISGRPLQYILGEWEFYGLPFLVGEGVLIPRPDTEILVERALEFLRDKPTASVLDLCAGSGCISVAVAKNSDTSVTAVELSDTAFGYLKKNIELNAAQVTAVQDDVLQGIEGEFDLILSNPPYIRSDVLPTLSREVQNEPQMALDGGADGLDFYRAIALKYKGNITPGGRLMFEIGYDQREAVTELLAAAGYKNIVCFKDYGGNDRVVSAEILNK